MTQSNPDNAALRSTTEFEGPELEVLRHPEIYVTQDMDEALLARLRAEVRGEREEQGTLTSELVFSDQVERIEAILRRRKNTIFGMRDVMSVELETLLEHLEALDWLSGLQGAMAKDTSTTRAFREVLSRVDMLGRAKFTLEDLRSMNETVALFRSLVPE